MHRVSVVVRHENIWDWIAPEGTITRVQVNETDAQVTFDHPEPAELRLHEALDEGRIIWFVVSEEVVQ